MLVGLARGSTHPTSQIPLEVGDDGAVMTAEETRTELLSVIHWDMCTPNGDSDRPWQTWPWLLAGLIREEFGTWKTTRLSKPLANY